ncbi:MAG: hypothetical protein ABI241_00555 [Bacteroidia bacterium]
MGVYDLDTNFIGVQILPPPLRTRIHKAWVKMFLTPLMTLWKYIFVDYADGSIYMPYNNVALYSVGDKIIYADKRVYQCKANCTGIKPSNLDFWFLINPIFMGARERIMYNSQVILYEYALNKYFLVTAAPYIYISNNISSSFFVMGASSSTSSNMAANSLYSSTYMGINYSVTSNNFTIYVPSALFATLGTNDANRINAIRAFADQYVLAGINYNVIQY